jgi:hypothetical protein
MNTKKIRSCQIEFSFASEPEIYRRPPISERALCCSSVPEPHPHQIMGSCYADHPPRWMGPLTSRKKISSGGGGQPPADTPKSQTASDPEGF